MLKKEKNRLNEDNMSRDENSPSDRVEAAVTTMVRGIPKKDTCHGTCTELVWGGGRDVRITKATEDSKISV
jgi:hypothetical protein